MFNENVLVIETLIDVRISKIDIDKKYTWRITSNEIEQTFHRTQSNKRVGCNSAIEQNRTQNFFVSSMPEPNRIKSNRHGLI